MILSKEKGIYSMEGEGETFQIQLAGSQSLGKERFWRPADIKRAAKDLEEELSKAEKDSG